MTLDKEALEKAFNASLWATGTPCDRLAVAITAYLSAIVSEDAVERVRRCVINMRVPEDQLAVIDNAARIVGKTRTRFLLDCAREDALRVLRERGPALVPGPTEPARPATPREFA